MEADPQNQLTLRDYLRPIWARKWLVLGIVVAVTAAVYVYYNSKDPLYEATTRLDTAEEGNPLLGVGSGFSDDRTVQNQATLLTSSDVARAVARRIKYDGSPGSLADRVTAEPAAGADFITISATGRSGQEAADIANGFAQAFIDLRSADRREAAAKAIEQLREQLAEVKPGPAGASARESIQGDIRQLEVATSSGAGPVRQIDPAEASTQPSSTPPWQRALAAAFAALLGGMLLAYVLHRLDPRIRTIDDAAEIYRRPVMATVFEDEEIDHFEDGRPATSERSRETFRQMKTSVDLAAVDRRFRTILVTSASPGEGKSTVVRNLALAMHEAGRRVAIVDADLRKPSQPALLGVEPKTGVTTYLAGASTFDDSIVRVSVTAPDLALAGGPEASSAGASAGVQHLTLVPAGPTPANPPALLESQAFAKLIEQLTESHDVVIIDTPPIAAVTDAITLISRADALIVVARSGVTTRSSARRAVDIIERVPDANFVGVVVNGLAITGGGEFGYGYSYYKQ